MCGVIDTTVYKIDRSSLWTRVGPRGAKKITLKYYARMVGLGFDPTFLATTGEKCFTCGFISHFYFSETYNEKDRRSLNLVQGTFCTLLLKHCQAG